ncbi:leukemia inhibitory factor receptor isoform X1 [Macaca thibetana thibetana]|uniref:Leukemia inhibitory factor receptor n=1 Tax=Macaca mulatta TaxID=9544 RepID=F7E0D3_MACMU|nr:leukemia inhibitory factor receptor isoform X1 [Macaca mulatta]XP_014995408.1 leukemia inhibitory factor receptor isoform X1 [Macaca mulatta]XP_014995409.1 leukemia inhibitory factor receptor isoform X1 [Macaca mulatta]XP_050651068.1 leukemia inhibitory factor receptor isoform X1 [Macaca thibetana thibetana]XP_050651069.1 leukemia inhibitory factor receptor isoform X1 [Macaca thibetana thibetana]XP_050651070.1 leukemia inhibitory factor receptor isoform X1 [Macaca thibetana thibetana]XP_05
MMDIYVCLKRASWMVDNKRMRTASNFQWLLSTFILLYLMNQVNSQKKGAPRDLKCVTNNLQVWDCYWKAPSGTGRGTDYEVCIENRSHSCYQLEKTNIKIPALSHGDYEITINSLHDFGSSTSKFTLNEQNVSLIPDTPEILNLSADFSTSTLYLKWNDRGSVFPHHSNVIWEIKILRKESMELVKLVTHNTTLNGKDTLHHWSWASDMPLECAIHFVEIRCYIDSLHFSGRKEWSDWSPVKNISWMPDSQTKVFPQDKVILVGSDITFCCISQEKVLSALIGHTNCPLIHLDGENVAIKIHNISVSASSGTNVVFTTEDNIFGTVIFAGYPPDTPQQLNCETHDLKEILCSWNPGRATALVGPRATSYTLLESFSGKYVRFKRAEAPTNGSYQLFFQMLPNQEIYNFTLNAHNPLGRSESTILVNITEKVYPHTPTSFKVKDINSTAVKLSWHLPGNFAKINFLCQIEIKKSNTVQEQRNVTIKGVENSSYLVALDKLNPYTVYTFRIRCSTETFWKWSKWSNKKQHLTTEAIPSKGPDTWREWSSDGKNLIIYWKPLPINEANGKILSYNVSCSSDEETQSLSEIPDPQHKAEIQLDKNDYIISVVAKNSVGSSPPSKIASMEIPNDDLKIEQVVGMGKGILLTWHYDPNMTCDYVIKWCNSSRSEPCLMDWRKVPSNSTETVIESDQFRPGVRYNFFLYGCRNQGYQLLRSMIGYIEELAPTVAPNFTVEDTSADSILVKWEDIPVEELRGFLRGYLFYFGKGERDTSKMRVLESGRSDIKVKNITDISQKTLRIADLQGKTSYHLVLRAYTDGGVGPEKSMYVVTKENSVGLIIAILIPVAVAVIVGVVTSILCYRKREWIKETFYPDIPNPENCKALQFQKSVCEGSSGLKTLEMNPCTPNNVEVLETRSAFPKIEDTEIISPVAERPEDRSDAEPENHVVVSYCPPIIEEEIPNPAADEAGGTAQVIYIDVQSMYQPQAKPEEEQENDPVGGAGYKPQMHLPVNSTVEDIAAEEDLEKTAGYRPQANVNTWNLVSPDSPRSIDSNSEIVSFGSPCSINSRQFLIPPKDEDSPKSNGGGWSFTNFFQNKPND